MSQYRRIYIELGAGKIPVKDFISSEALQVSSSSCYIFLNFNLFNKKFNFFYY